MKQTQKLIKKIQRLEDIADLDSLRTGDLIEAKLRLRLWDDVAQKEKFIDFNGVLCYALLHAICPWKPIRRIDYVIYPFNQPYTFITRIDGQIILSLVARKEIDVKDGKLIEKKDKTSIYSKIQEEDFCYYYDYVHLLQET